MKRRLRDLGVIPGADEPEAIRPHHDARLEESAWRSPQTRQSAAGGARSPRDLQVLSMTKYPFDDGMPEIKGADKAAG